MKKSGWSLLWLLVGLLVRVYTAPVSPFIVANSDMFPEETNYWICSVFDELYFAYSTRFDDKAFVLKPLAHLCLSAQLRNIRSMDSEILQSEIDYLTEVYNLNLDNLNRQAYREKHIDKFEWKTYENNDWMYVPHTSLSFTEEEIFNLLLWSVEKARRMLSSEYPDQYLVCKNIITEETTIDALSDAQWECIMLSYKVSAKYADKYEFADAYRFY